MNKIKELREKEGLSLQGLQDALKNKLGVSIGRASLNNYERGEQTPNTEKWEILAEYFGVSVPYIMGLSDEKNSNDEKLIALLQQADDTNKEIKDDISPILQALRITMNFIDEPDDCDSKLVIDTLLRAINTVNNFASRKDRDNELSDLKDILGLVDNIHMRSGGHTLYSKEKSIETHLTKVNEVTDILHTWYMSQMDEMKFNVKESYGID